MNVQFISFILAVYCSFNAVYVQCSAFICSDSTVLLQFKWRVSAVQVLG